MGPVSPVMSINGKHFGDVPTDQITPLNIDEEGNTYFDFPHALPQDAPPGQPWADDGSMLIDPTLVSLMEPPTAPTSDQTVVTVPRHLAEASTRILIYLSQIIEIPEDAKDMDNEPITDETTFTAEETETLESIDEEGSEPFSPTVIDGIRVNQDPMPMGIREVLDLRRIGPDRQSFYLARTINGTYYWFHSPYAYRDRHLRKVIGEYRRKTRVETPKDQTRGVKRLRSGKLVTM